MRFTKRYYSPVEFINNSGLKFVLFFKICKMYLNFFIRYPLNSKDWVTLLKHHKIRLGQLINLILYINVTDGVQYDEQLDN